MRGFGWVCGIVTLLASTACWRPNVLFDSTEEDLTEGRVTESSGGDGSSGSGGLECAAVSEAPPATVAFCELESPPAIDIAAEPEVADQCDMGPQTLWARREVDTPNRIELCDERCETCAPTDIDLSQPRFKLFDLSILILPGAGECMRIEHEIESRGGACRTTGLAIFDPDDPAPRFATAVGKLEPLPSVELAVAATEASSCACSEADKDLTVSDGEGLLYPCCETSEILHTDVIVTPADACPIRVARGLGNKVSLTHFGRRYDFALLNAYNYLVSCPAATGTAYWMMIRN